MRFAPLKSEAQLDLQTIHRVRQRLVGRRTTLISQLRAILLERGIIVPHGRRVLISRLPDILADQSKKLGFSHIKLKWLWARLEQLSGMRLTRRAADEARRAPEGSHPTTAWRLITIEVSPNSAMFSCRLDRKKLRGALRRRCRPLRRRNGPFRVCNR